MLLKILLGTISDYRLRVSIQSKDINAMIGALWYVLNLLDLLILRMKKALGRIRKSQYKPKGLPRVDRDR